MSYKVIDGVRYEKALLDMADAFAQAQIIGLNEVQQLYASAWDGRRITEIEKKTLFFIRNRYPLTTDAGQWLDAQFAAKSDFQQSIERIIRKEFGLKGMRWLIDEAEVSRRMRPEYKRTFEEILRGAIDAFLHWSQGPLSLSAVIGLGGLSESEVPNMDMLIKSFLNKATLYLIPRDSTIRAGFVFEAPHISEEEFEQFWVFGLEIPELKLSRFAAYVHHSAIAQHNKGYLAQRPPLEERIPEIIRFHLGFDELNWNIDAEEVNKQLALQNGQNFSNALWSALRIGIFNGESSFAFSSYVDDEIWPDPERARDEYLIEYIDTGTIHLLPYNYRELQAAGHPVFFIPENFHPDPNYNWVFGLEMPAKTNLKAVIHVDRAGGNLEFSWNDAFVHDERSFEEQINDIIEREFDLKGLVWNIAEAEAQAQIQQLGPDWRPFMGVLRQTLNTFLHDYQGSESVFQNVANVHTLFEENFDNPYDHRYAVSQQAREYLRDGILHLVPANIYSVAEDDIEAIRPPEGRESVEENWIFQLSLPTLSDHLYWAIIPRWGDEEHRPYNYGFN